MIPRGEQRIPEGLKRWKETHSVWNKGKTVSVEEYPNFGARKYNATKEDSKIREKISKTLKEKYKNGILVSPMKGKHLSIERRKMISEIAKSRSPEINKKISETVKRLRKEGRYSQQGLKLKELLKNNTELRNRYIENVRKSHIESPNKLEIKIMKIIEKYNLGFEYTGNKRKSIVGRKIPDFMHSSDKKILEVFGRHWHKPDEEQPIISFYKKYGYDCVVLWEDVINRSSEDFIVNKINGGDMLCQNRSITISG